jgi:predicted unusual protein kinase regulating ubiquinone biosynthesis (AarF/ABC1/UbiB family)
VFNGDPHPGNYRFEPGGRVTFLDFGLVKRWGPGELEGLSPVLDAVLDGNVARTEQALVTAGFLPANHGIDPERIYYYVSRPDVPFQTEEFTYTRAFVAEMIETLLDIQGEYSDVIRASNMPPSYVILDRVVWGMSALLGRLEARNHWRALLEEYRKHQPPSTALGLEEEEWRKTRAAAASA